MRNHRLLLSTSGKFNLSPYFREGHTLHPGFLNAEECISAFFLLCIVSSYMRSKNDLPRTFFLTPILNWWDYPHPIPTLFLLSFKMCQYIHSKWWVQGSQCGRWIEVKQMRASLEPFPASYSCKSICVITFFHSLYGNVPLLMDTISKQIQGKNSFILRKGLNWIFIYACYVIFFKR